jgi:hypothetical protein
MRRLLHLALLLAIMLGIRACGGMAVTEDRLNASTRWIAEKVGLSSTKEAFDARVRPPMASATQSMSESIYTTTSRAMDSVELATGTFSGWLLQSIRSGLGLVDETFQPVAAAPAKPSDPRDREEEEKERRARSR